jgi:hypothetical protein
MSTETDNICWMSRNTVVRIVSKPHFFHNSSRNGSLATNTWLLNGYCNVLLELAADLFSCGVPGIYHLVRHIRGHFDRLNDHLSDRREMRSNAQCRLRLQSLSGLSPRQCSVHRLSREAYMPLPRQEFSFSLSRNRGRDARVGVCAS